MKKLLFFTFLFFLTLGSYAQIQNVIPSQPTIVDSISFEIKTFIPLGSSFPADCPPFVGYTDSLKQNTLLVYDLYFDLSGGWLNHGCVRYDTVDVSSNLPSGNYIMIAYWHTVMDTSPTVTGQQYDTTARQAPDTFYFTVSSITGLPEFSNNQIKLFPNPVKEKLELTLSSVSRVG